MSVRPYAGGWSPASSGRAAESFTSSRCTTSGGSSGSKPRATYRALRSPPPAWSISSISPRGTTSSSSSSVLRTASGPSKSSSGTSICCQRRPCSSPGKNAVETFGPCCRVPQSGTNTVSASLVKCRRSETHAVLLHHPRVGVESQGGPVLASVCVNASESSSGTVALATAMAMLARSVSMLADCLKVARIDFPHGTRWPPRSRPTSIALSCSNGTGLQDRPWCANCRFWWLQRLCRKSSKMTSSGKEPSVYFG
eukprot:scaffold32690_cov65-Phaeocystis_antarctica.AAC.6